MENEIRVGMPLIITDEDIDDIMSSALDYISYWCRGVEVVGEYLGEYASEQIARGGELIFHCIEDPVDETPEILNYKLDRKRFIQAVDVWLSELDDEAKNEILDKGFNYYGLTLDCGQIDGPRSDAIIQLALFDEVVFG